ncbi:MAG: polymer-forming cytoskeletal protein [Lachnospiraceae bacterium]|nr:polymer-forming cytoskeletal protein [Lachnospiraceae bacterium]
MGFFKEFKEDLSEAVDELIPGGDYSDEAEDDVDLAVEQSIDVDSELSKLDGLLEQATKKAEADEARESAAAKVTSSADFVAEKEKTKAATVSKKKTEEIKMEETLKNTNDVVMESAPAPAPAPAAGSMAPASDENAVITSGMKITGDLESTGSIDVEGIINGNVRCNGKLTVTGTIVGNSISSEFFADSAKIEGEVNTTGTVKIGVGSVVIGNITATSAVIAGAVKGDIDVQGPVVVDTSAVVMGNIKSRSVQINNGAVIEGFCSQAYAEVDVASVFA